MVFHPRLAEPAGARLAVAEQPALEGAAVLAAVDVVGVAPGADEIPRRFRVPVPVCRERYGDVDA